MTAKRLEALWNPLIAGATLLLVGATLLLVRETREGTKRQIGVQSWLTFVARFDSREMRKARKNLATELKYYDPTKHQDLSETVLDFFDDVGAAYRVGYLDKGLAESTFSYYANYWWAASHTYIRNQRADSDNDQSGFDDFEYLAKAMHRRDPKIDDKALSGFLEDERRLNTD